MRWPAANVKSFGSSGIVKSVAAPIVSGSIDVSELRFAESRMPCSPATA